MPRVPRPGSRRSRALEEQRQGIRAGIFQDRVIAFPFTTLAGGSSQASNVTVTSMGASEPAGSGQPVFVRLLALRCLVAQGVDVTPDEIPLFNANVRLRLQLNALSDFVGGNAPVNDASFLDLCSVPSAPWYWWADPPRMRTGDVLRATVRNTFSGEGSAVLPVVHIRVMADDLWRQLFIEEAI